MCELRPEGIELFVKRCASHTELCIVELKLYVAFFQDYWELQIHVVHVDLGYLYGVERPLEGEVSMHYVARIECYQRVSGTALEV